LAALKRNDYDHYGSRAVWSLGPKSSEVEQTGLFSYREHPFYECMGFADRLFSDADQELMRSLENPTVSRQAGRQAGSRQAGRQKC
jgi:hypothetical protein